MFSSNDVLKDSLNVKNFCSSKNNNNENKLYIAVDYPRITGHRYSNTVIAIFLPLPTMGQYYRKQMNRSILCTLFVLIYTIKSIDSCSPPRSKYGDQTIQQLSELGRSDKAEIIVLGTVVKMFPDKKVQSMLVDIAVHMVLKSKKRMEKIIKVSGFENAGKSNRNTLFVHQASTDCVTTEVNLYGTYVFFLRTNEYNEFSVDEINFQPAVTEILCDSKLRKEMKRLIKKYRKARKNKPQCNDFENNKTETSRKCLKHRNFTKLLNNFKYKLLPIRKYYCTIRREAARQKKLRKLRRKNRKKKKKKKKTSKVELQMHDIILKSNEHTYKVSTVIRKRVEKTEIENTPTMTVSTDEKSPPTNIIVYSKNENYILHQNRNQNLHVKLRNWRLFNDGESTSSASSPLKLTSHKYGQFMLLLFLTALTLSTFYWC